MKAKRFPITIVLFWIVLVLTAFLVENIALLTSEPKEGLGAKLFIFIFLITIVFASIYLFYERKYNKIKIDWLVLGIITIFFIINVFVIFSQPASQIITGKDNGVEVSADFTIKDKFIYALQLFITLVMVYIFLVPYKKRAYALKVQTWAYWLFVAYALVTVICSFYLDREQYANFVKPNAERQIQGVKSFYPNQNFYGYTMMMVLMVLMVIQIKRSRIWNTALMLFFFIAGIYSACSTTVVASSFIFLIYYIYDIIHGFRTKPARTGIRLLFVILMWFIGFIVVILLYDSGVPWMKTPVDFCVVHFVTEGNKGFLSLSIRSDMWTAAEEIIYRSPKSIIFGDGFKTGSWLVHCQANANAGGGMGKYDCLTAHSTLFEIWVRFGIIGLALYTILLIDFIVSDIYLIVKKERRFAIIMLICFVGIVLHGVTESSIFFEGNTKGLTITLFFFMPVISKRYQYQLQGRKELINYHHDKEAKRISFDLVSRVMSNVFIMMMASIIPLFASKLMYQGRRAMYFAIAFAY